MATKPKQKAKARIYAPPLERPANYVNPITPEMIEHMRDCEAREWIKRFRAKAKMSGYKEASNWWQEHLEVMRRIRGESAILDLRRRMTEQQKQEKTR